VVTSDLRQIDGFSRNTSVTQLLLPIARALLGAGIEALCSSKWPAHFSSLRVRFFVIPASTEPFCSASKIRHVIAAGAHEWNVMLF
jgi:hypothetical protein